MSYAQILAVVLAIVATGMVVLIWKPSSALGTIATLLFLGLVYVVPEFSMPYNVILSIITVEVVFIAVASYFAVTRVRLYLHLRQSERDKRMRLFAKMVDSERDKLHKK